MVVHLNKTEDIANTIRVALNSKYKGVYNSRQANDMIIAVLQRVNQLMSSTFRLVLTVTVNYIRVELYATTSRNRIGNLVYIWNSGFRL